MILDTCWICGGGPLTREHRTKKSDLRAVFGRVLPDAPLFWHDKGRANQRLRSLDADILKSGGRICAHCNNARTQPHDKAWETLSAELRQRLGRSRPSALRTTSVFPYDTRRQLLNVHLFFAKLFGCFIVDHDIPIDQAGFARAIMEQRPHPQMFLKFGLGPLFGGARMTGCSNIHVAMLENSKHAAFATWFYCVEPVAVHIMFSDGHERRRGTVGAWHPGVGTTRLHLADFESELKERKFSVGEGSFRA